MKIRLDRGSTDYSSLYMTVKLTKSSTFIRRAFPLGVYVENGLKHNSNDLAEHLAATNSVYHCDHVSLQDLVVFQHYNYEILSGIIYERRNYEIQNIVQYLFQRRVAYKQVGNSIEKTYKLCLNSLYGKLIEGNFDTGCEIIEQEELDTYLYEHHNATSYDRMPDSSKVFVETQNEVNTQTGYHHVGILILAVSKRLMNQVMCLAEDMDILIQY